MRKFILLCLLVFTVSSVVFAQQMTDEQVILYVQEAQSQGGMLKHCFPCTKRTGNKSRSPFYNGVDRINNTDTGFQ